MASSAILVCCCLLAVAMSASIDLSRNSTLSPEYRQNTSLSEDKSEGRGIRKAILPLLLGIVLKVSTLVPMKLMIMTFFAIMALMTSKLALLIAAVTALFQKNHHHHQSVSYQRLIDQPVIVPQHIPALHQFDSFSSAGAANLENEAQQQPFNTRRRTHYYK